MSVETRNPNPQDSQRPWLDQAQSYGLIVGAGGLLLCLLLGLVPAVGSASVVRAYLAAYVFWIGLSLGGIGLTSLHHLTGGAWGVIIRRPLEAAAMTILPMAVLFLPIAVGMKAIYPWTDPDFVQAHEAVQHKIAWLNTNGWMFRAVGYFAFWIVCALLLNHWSRQQDSRADLGPTQWLKRVSGPILALIFVSASFAAVDWMMSLEPDWFSTIYGPMLLCGWALSTFAATTIVGALLNREEPMSRYAGPIQFNDLGNLMLAFTMLWAYCSFMQFLIIWSGNLTEEIPWYLRRIQGGWAFFAILLIIFHFFAPFIFLLMRDLKRRPEMLMKIAALILGMHLLNSIWLILPSQFLDPLVSSENPIYVPWGQVLITLLAAAGIGGLWVWFFVGRLKTGPVVPINDPAAERLLMERTHQAKGHGV